MKGKSITKLIVSFFIFFILFLPFFVMGQGGGPGGPGTGQDPACDPQCNCYPEPPYAPCPIDSYLYILLGIGVLYGIKKVRDEKKTASNSLVKQD
jgi:hypothetical protein